HRRAVGGAGSQAWVTLFASANLVDLLPGPLDNTAVRLVTQSNVDASFDNVKVESSSNLDEFLHLAPNSVCIDTGSTERVDPADPESDPIAFRDFSDQLGPVDGDDPGPPQDEDEIPQRDIGADEWPQPMEVPYWWESP